MGERIHNISWKNKKNNDSTIQNSFERKKKMIKIYKILYNSPKKNQPSNIYLTKEKQKLQNIKEK